MTLDEARARVGDGVLCRPPGGKSDDADEGTITSVSDRWVFVRYGISETSRAADPGDLELLGRPARDLRGEEYDRCAYNGPGIRL